VVKNDEGGMMRRKDVAGFRTRIRGFKAAVVGFGVRIRALKWL
jgi:hypothetical protein